MSETSAAAAANHFTCKDLSPKKAVALQILGYSVLSLLGENLEEAPTAHLRDFKDIAAIVEAVDICPTLWLATVAALSPTPPPIQVLLALDETVRTEEALAATTDAIITELGTAQEPYNIIDELIENQELSEERIDALIALFTHKPTKRSHTLRVKGRRAITPVRRNRHHKN